LGLFDMHGNVWEWCADSYAADYYLTSPPADPPGPAHASVRVYRGGSWSSAGEHCRAAYRCMSAPFMSYGFLGFRVAVGPQ
jgi:formylglycine-generating enzyme required for sulfatase activity